MGIFGSTSASRDRRMQMYNANLASQAEARARADIAAAQPQQLEAVQQGFDRAQAEYRPWAQGGEKAFAMQQDATGLNGTEGVGRAQAAFTPSMDYNFRQHESADQTARYFDALGMGLSGNAIQAVQDRSSNLAAGEYGNWFTRLGELSGRGYGAATGIASAAQSLGQNTANIWGGNTKALIDAANASVGRQIDANNASAKA